MLDNGSMLKSVSLAFLLLLMLAFWVPSASANTCPLQDDFAGGGRGPSSGPREWYTSSSVYMSSNDNPLGGRDWFVDCQWGEAWTGSRTSSEVVQAKLEPIRTEPIAKWFGPTHQGVYNTVSAYLDRVDSQAPGALPVMVWSKMESGYCRPGGYISPDPAVYGSAVYRENVREFVRALRDHPVAAVVVIEPDELASLGCLPSHARRSRLSRISYAVDQISQLQHITAYVDAGASDWMGWKTMIKYLRQIGISKIRGFSLNTTHYDWTLDNIAYGNQMAKRLGKHFVVNTARNGNGPITPELRAKGYEGGCNIPNAGMGLPPTTNTHSVWSDAYLWVLNPGFSDGPCRHGKNYRTDRVRWDTPLALHIVKQRSTKLRGKQISYYS